MESSGEPIGRTGQQHRGSSSNNEESELRQRTTMRAAMLSSSNRKERLHTEEKSTPPTAFLKAEATPTSFVYLPSDCASYLYTFLPLADIIYLACCCQFTLAIAQRPASYPPFLLFSTGDDFDVREYQRMASGEGAPLADATAADRGQPESHRSRVRA
jgi:hypothetical protein